MEAARRPLADAERLAWLGAAPRHARDRWTGERLWYYASTYEDEWGLPTDVYNDGRGLVGEWGFERVAEEEAPDAYKENPLANGDDAEALLHFTELSTGGYRLHTFVRV